MTEIQACEHCKIFYPASDFRGLIKSNESLSQRVCIQCRIKESLRIEIRQAQETLAMTQSLTGTLEGWTFFEIWLKSHTYRLDENLLDDRENIMIFTHGQSGRYALIWTTHEMWYGGIVSISIDDKILIPITMRWSLGGYVSAVSAGVHVLYYLGMNR